MRVDTKKRDGKQILLVAATILIALLLSNLSLAGVVDVIKDELDEHDILSSLTDKNTDEGKSISATSPQTHKSGSSSSSNSNYDSGSSASQTQTANTQSIEGAYAKPVKPDLYSEMQRYVGYYNNGIDEVPDVVKKVAGNDVILLDIAQNDNTNLKIKAVTKDGVITEFQKVSSSSGIDPTVSVLTDETTIKAILHSDDPTSQLSSSLNSGTLDIECKGFLKKAAVSALKAFA
ncbi:hypothetical protein [Methanolobus sp. ZRKC5]|uniref:hypothetical protein n=1 Tax=unclassified Methanolobus TaxID=2629569 RepID=UPI00313C814C